MRRIIVHFINSKENLSFNLSFIGEEISSDEEYILYRREFDKAYINVVRSNVSFIEEIPE